MVGPAFRSSLYEETPLWVLGCLPFALMLVMFFCILGLLSQLFK
jgi:hypothetical protein